MEEEAATWGVRGVLTLTFTLVVGFLAPSVQADVTRTQTISLKKGWNAVFLEVEPLDSEPAVVFKETPIKVAATWFSRASPVEFISDPESEPWNNEGWGVWYSGDRPDAVLTSLYAIQGARSYLIKSESDFIWNVSGAPLWQPVQWKANSYNFVGFCLDPQSPPTFEKFFGGSEAHLGSKIYRLENGVWKQVINPAATLMRAGEACWVYCRTGSSYQGPVKLRWDTESQGGLLFGSTRSTGTIIVENLSSDPVEVEIEETGALPLSLVVKGLNTEAKQLDSLGVDVGNVKIGATFQPGQRFGFEFEVPKERMQRSLELGLLKITTDLGTRHWIPLISRRKDLDQN